MVTAARAAAVVLVATATVLATVCTRIVDDARVVAAADMGKAGFGRLGVHVGRRAADNDPGPRRRRAGDEDPAARRVGAGDDDGLGADPVHDAQHQPGQGRLRADRRGHTRKPAGCHRSARGVRRASTRRWSRASAPPTCTSREHTLCGLPAETIDYITPPIGPIAPHPAKVVCAVLQTDDATFAMTVTVQTADPDNPTYQRDAETILTGFQMLPPTDA